jgi:hypothetical protein
LRDGEGAIIERERGRMREGGKDEILHQDGLYMLAVLIMPMLTGTGPFLLASLYRMHVCVLQSV